MARLSSRLMYMVGRRFIFRGLLLSIVRLGLVIRFILRSRFGLEVKVQAKSQAKMVNVQCEVKFSLLFEG